MSEPLSEERLAELVKQFVDSERVWDMSFGQLARTGIELAREVKRQRAELAARDAENERLRAVLADIAYNTSTSIPFAAPPETYIVGQLRSCIGRAARALRPEPASCHAMRDGDCAWEGCPQDRDGEPARSGRHCPLDTERDS